MNVDLCPQNFHCGNGVYVRDKSGKSQHFIPYSPMMILYRFSYEHKITGSKTGTIPYETGGGILADDMGLGKSLTMLTAISRTRQAAQVFVEETCLELRKPSERSKASQVPSRASLVVVPTPCKCMLELVRKLKELTTSVLLDNWEREIQT